MRLSDLTNPSSLLIIDVDDERSGTLDESPIQTRSETESTVVLSETVKYNVLLKTAPWCYYCKLTHQNLKGDFGSALKKMNINVDIINCEKDKKSCAHVTQYPTWEYRDKTHIGHTTDVNVILKLVAGASN